MWYLIIAVCAAVGTTLTLKVATSKGMSIPTLNSFYRLGMGISALIGLLFSFSPLEMPALFAATWGFVLPGVIFLYFAGITAMNAISAGPIGISAVVIRSSMLLPVGYSLIILNQEDPERFRQILPFACIGCVLILFAFGLLGAEGRTQSGISVRKTWVFWLVGAFIAHGGWDTVVVASTRLGDRDLLFCYYLTSLGAALLSMRGAKFQVATSCRPLIAAGLGAGVLALTVSLIRPLAVKELGALIAIPSFSIGSMFLIQLLGSLVWKQHIGPAGWLGFVFSGMGIIVLVWCK